MSLRAEKQFTPLRLCGSLALSLLLLTVQAFSQPIASSPVRAMHGMVSSDNEEASRIGMEVLRNGGNAVDAAVAVALALAVTHPAAGNLGGGGFLLVRMHDGRTVAIDYREVAPLAASRKMYLNAKGDLLPDESLVGYRAVGVPGTVAGLALALEKYGTRKWSDLVEPARALAQRGFVLSKALSNDLRRAENLSKFAESRHIFQRDGKFYPEGSLFRQPDMAQTLQRLQANGPREFYEGETAKRIVADMKANGGLLTLEDLQRYRPVLREPLRGTYRGYDILTMPPPSSGGVALLEMLNILETYDLRALGKDSASRTHLLIEAMRRAFADRAEFLGDPDFVRVPTASLISKAYAATRRKTINLHKATPSANIGHGKPAGHESTQTTHFSIVDAEGNAVSNTYTLNMGFGSGVTAKGTGVLLNNEMDDFAAKPGSPNGFGLIQGESNAIAPRKRPLSSMTPTIVTRDGRLFCVVGSPGGPTIINTVLQILLHLIDDDMDIRQAILAPRLHHQWQPDQIVYERNGLTPEVVQALKTLGHRFAKRPVSLGVAHGIQIDAQTGERLGSADPRWPDGRAIGY